MAVGDAITVDVTGLAPGGDAVGRQVGGAQAGRVTFVPLAAPGERVRARLTREKARLAWAELISIDVPGPDRVTPPCPLFGRCGGCQWQHVAEEAQRRAKGEIVARALGVGVGPARAVGPGFGYRDRVRVVVGEAGRVGFRARRSNDVVDVPSCPLVTPPLASAWPAMRAMARSLPAGQEISLQASRDGAVGVALGGRIERLTAEGAGWRAIAVAEGDRAGWPDASEPGGRELRLPPGAFAQVGFAATAALVDEVMTAVGRAERVLELYAGSGTFTRGLVARAQAVIASDGDRAAVARGRANVPEAQWRAPAELARDLDFDVAVVDPPREGLDAQSLGLAARARTRLVYVSCDPQTLGRDARALGERGWAIERAAAFDLMPQTHHVEVVAVFVRR